MNSIMTPGVLGSNVTIQCAAMFFWTVGARGRRGGGRFIPHDFGKRESKTLPSKDL